jgi:outer membrane protein assembly factor BamB
MKRFSLFSLMIAGALLLSACGSASTLSWAGLAADAQNAYLASGQHVYAVSLSNGSKVWDYTATGGQIFNSTPALTASGSMLIGSTGNDFTLTAIDTAKFPAQPAAPVDWYVPILCGIGLQSVGCPQPVNVQEWQFTGARDHWVASPLVLNDVVYAPNNDGTLYALNLSSGALSWSLPISKSLWGTPVSNGQLLFVTSLDHFIYGVDPAAHKIVWKTDLGGSVPAAPALSADGQTLYVGSFGAQVFALKAADGSILWKAATGGWIWGTPVVSGANVVAADLKGQVYSIDAATGKQNWPSVLPGGAITGSPLVLADGSVIVATDSGTLYAYHADGTPWWHQSLSGKLYTTPISAGDDILVAPYGGDDLLVAVHKDGTIHWQFTGK